MAGYVAEVANWAGALTGSPYPLLARPDRAATSAHWY
jgi:hypothetical protein